MAGQQADRGPGLDLKEVQGNITPGFRKDFQDLLFVRFPTPAAGQAWLRSLRPEIASAAEVATFNRLHRLVRERPWDDAERFVRSTWVNVALSSPGLETLSPDEHQTFPEAFRQGMVKRIAKIGDDEDRLPRWEVRDGKLAGEDSGTASRVADALLILGADTAAELDAELGRQCERLASHGLALILRYRGQTLGQSREHFGFRDSVSQPDPDDPLNGWVTSEQIVEPGEFILGQTAEPKRNEQDDDGVGMANLSGLADDGSFLVFRKLRQDVAAFRRAVASEAGKVNLSAGQLAAKLVGRWPSGAKLGHPLEPEAEAPEWDQEQARLRLAEFTADQYGVRFPLLCHIRKANPRVRLEGQQDPPVNFRRKRLIRRGVPYGPPLPAGRLEHDGHERGLLFLAYQADLERQFEFVQRDWLNDDVFPRVNRVTADEDACAGRPARSLGGADPLTGVVDQTRRPRTVWYPHPHPGCPTGLTLNHFVSVEAGGYFFAPSISALGRLAGLGDRASATTHVPPRR